MIAILHGPDAFLVGAELRRLRSKHDPDGLNTTALDGRSARLDEITAALGTPGFFGSGRVIVVADLLTIGSKGTGGDADDAEPKRGKPAIDWAALFGAVEAGNVGIFVDPELASVPAAAKKALPPGTTVFAGESPRGAELLGWIRERAKAAGSTMQDADARYLAETLSPKTWGAKPANPAYDRPPDLELFASEIGKLALAADGAITRATIDEMTAAAQPDSLFPLVDAFVAGDAAGALRELRVAIEGGEEIGRVNVQLVQQVELMAALHAAGPRTEPAELGKALGLSNPNRMFAVQKSLGRLRAHPAVLVEQALEAERSFKRGVLRQPVDQVYGLLEGSSAAARQTR